MKTTALFLSVFALMSGTALGSAHADVERRQDMSGDAAFKCGTVDAFRDSEVKCDDGYCCRSGDTCEMTPLGPGCIRFVSTPGVPVPTSPPPGMATNPAEDAAAKPTGAAGAIIGGVFGLALGMV